MGIREQLNQKPAITTGATIGIMVLALGFIVYEIRGGSSGQYRVLTDRFYSDDDGATYFKDSLTKIAPYDHDGKQAVVANVFRCQGGKPFVGYLQRYTAKGVKAMTAAAAKTATPSVGPNPIDELQQTESEYSLPMAGDKGWKKATAKGADAILNVKCPEGNNDTLEPYLPGD